MYYAKFADGSQKHNSRRMEDYKQMKDHLKSIPNSLHDGSGKNCQCGSSAKCVRQILDKYLDGILRSPQETMNKSKLLNDVNSKLIKILWKSYSSPSVTNEEVELLFDSFTLAQFYSLSLLSYLEESP